MTAAEFVEWIKDVADNREAQKHYFEGHPILQLPYSEALELAKDIDGFLPPEPGKGRVFEEQK